MICSGAISVCPGIPEAMKSTAPYSPTDRATDSPSPLSHAGSSAGKITRRNVYHRPAPRLDAASSISRSMSCNTGCTLRTMNGRPTNTRTSTTPPTDRSSPPTPREFSTHPSEFTTHPPMAVPPSHPLGEYRLLNVIPATAVGSANGRSISASKNRRPGNVYRTRTHAMISPMNALISVAKIDAPKLSLYDANTSGSRQTVPQNWSHVRVDVLSTSAPSGISTISVRYVSVYPSDSPNPGSTLRRRRGRRGGVTSIGDGAVAAVIRAGEVDAKRSNVTRRV